MKQLILAIAATTVLFSACNNSQKNETTSTGDQSAKNDSLFTCSMHPEVTGKIGDKCNKCGMELTEEVKGQAHKHDVSHAHDSLGTLNKEEVKPEEKPSTDLINNSKQPSYTLNKVYKAYFSLTDALTKDDGQAAQTASTSLFNKIANVDASKMNEAEKAIWSKFKAKLSNDAARIREVNENESQRKYFESLSKNMYEVMKVIKYDQAVYYQHCPMANEGKGANWLSLNSKINNPYYGAAMSTCGKTVETLK